MGTLRSLREHLEETLRSTAWQTKSHADIDALAFSILVTSETVAVELMADNDVGIAIAAGGPARAAWEAAVNAAWMVAPDSPAERDRRWLCLLQSERVFWAKIKADCQVIASGSTAIAAADAEVARLDSIIQAANPQLRAAGVGPPTELPDFRPRLMDLGKERQYFMWRQASQFIHPGNRALERVRSLTAVAGSAVRIALALASTLAVAWAVARLRVRHGWPFTRKAP